MQMLKLSLSLPDDAHPEMELRVSTNDTECDVVVAIPARAHDETAVTTDATVTRAEDDYVLGGYAGN